MKYSKQIKGERARRALLKGAKLVYDAVSTTLGARGRNVAINEGYKVKVIHDGVKTAEKINPKDKFLATGAEILKQAARKQVDLVGDGTTVSIILGYSIAKEALKVVNSGINPMGLRASLERGRDILVEEMYRLATPIESKEDKINIATISSEDKEMGEMIGETYHKAGTEAVITAEQISGSKTFVDHEEGMQIDAGYKSEWFWTNPRAKTSTINKARILVTDHKIDNLIELQKMFNELNESKEKNIVIIADDFEDEALALLIQNKMKGAINVNAIKAPAYQQENFLKDIATVVGAKFISAKARHQLKDVGFDDLGYASKVTSNKTTTVITGGGGEPELIKEKIKDLKIHIDEEEQEHEKEKLKERLAKLTGGVYVLKVGGATEVEAEERYERADDAIRSTQSAIQEGVVAGGETIFLRILDKLESNNENEDYAFRILKKALAQPFVKLITNAGYDAGEMRTKIKSNLGIDVTDGRVVDMVDKGIIDPVAVPVNALKNGLSVAISIITSEVVIVEHEENEK